MTDEPTERHNAVIFPLLKMLTSHATNEPEQWVVIESLCLAIGKLHNRTPRQTAEFIDAMADRLTTGERA